MTDHELLELAALAAGMHQFSIEKETGWPMVLYLDPRGNRFAHWNPLTEDGDVFRLCVDVDIRLAQHSGMVIADFPFVDDRRKAARRAAVRAAAAIGEGMAKPTVQPPV